MADARRTSIGCIVVWKLDRFGRSLKHLITALEELKHFGVSFISHRESLDSGGKNNGGCPFFYFFYGISTI